MSCRGNFLRILYLGCMLLAGTGLSAQQIMIKGRVTDKKTRQPVVAATISAKASQRTISDAQGRFVLGPEKLPVTLSVSHVSYGVTTVTVSKPATEIVINLEANVNPIPEARVSAFQNKLQILNRRARYTIIDYQFEDPYLWFIGCMDNSPRGARLYLGNPYGDTVCSVPVPKDVKLYRDYFGKIHMVRTDTVYQLFTDGETIGLMFPERTAKFMGIMSSWEVAFAQGLARLGFDSRNEELFLIFKDSTMDKPRRLFLYAREDEGYLEKRYAWIGRYFGPRTLQLVVNQQRENYFLRMRSSLFTFQDTLYVINLNDNQLHVMGRDLNEIRVVPVTFLFKDTDDITDAYVPFRIITDRVQHRAYVVFHINSHYTITPLNTVTGLTGPPLTLPRYSAMDKISIHDNTLYYIYPEKVYPYYQRLFKMELSEGN